MNHGGTQEEELEMGVARSTSSIATRRKSIEASLPEGFWSSLPYFSHLRLLFSALKKHSQKKSVSNELEIL